MAPSAAAGLPHTPTLFGDQLALARRSWVRRMAAGLGRAGYDDYRPSDAAVFRRLLRGPTPVGRLVDVLGATRQAARKIVEGLERRGYVTTERDATDARRLIVSLTPAGEGYARAVVADDDLRASLRAAPGQQFKLELRSRSLQGVGRQIQHR